MAIELTLKHYLKCGCEFPYNYRGTIRSSLNEPSYVDIHISEAELENLGYQRVEEKHHDFGRAPPREIRIKIEGGKLEVYRAE